MVNAMNAPKLMKDVEVLMSRKQPMIPTAATTRIALIGVFVRGDNLPKKRLGKTPSRPIANISREADAWAAIPDAN